MTGNDGTARVVYCPAAVTVIAVDRQHRFHSRHSIGTDASTSVGQSVDIRLMPTGIILPPSGQPTAAFTLRSVAGERGVPTIFDGSASTPGTNATQISRYACGFRRRSDRVGSSVTHSFRRRRAST